MSICGAPLRQLPDQNVAKPASESHLANEPLKADYVIVGAGLAGLYAAYQIRKVAPKASILVLEANAAAGGRAAMARFESTDIVLGAGIGRDHKDVLLIKLLGDLNVPFNTFPITHRYRPEISNSQNVAKDVSALKKAYEALKKPHALYTFKEFAQAQFGKAKASAFFESLSYTDMLQEDAGEVLQHYGLDDNYDGPAKARGFALSWSDLVKKLIAQIGEECMIYDATVKEIQTDPFGMKVVAANGTYMATEKLILAVTQPTLKRLLPKEQRYTQIGVNTFLRAYAKVSPESCPIMVAAIHSYTVVKPPLQKIIPINRDAGIYMVAYSDNESADTLRPYLQDTALNRQFWANSVEAALGLEKGVLKVERCMGKYWETGTHYLKPGFAGAAGAKAFFDHVQHPLPNVIVVGEVVSAQNRGWVEGALESVEAGIEGGISF